VTDWEAIRQLAPQLQYKSDEVLSAYYHELLAALEDPKTGAVSAGR